MGQYRLGDGCSILHGFAFAGMVESDDPNLPIVVNIGNFRYDGGFRLDSTRIQRYSGSYPPRFDLASGDLLLVMTCQPPGGEILGIPARVPEDGRRYVHNQRLGKVRIERADKLDVGYLYYLFLSKEFNAHLVATATGTKIVHTAPGRIEDYRWKCPSIEVQRRIASVLSAYDELIENIRRRIALVEAMIGSVWEHAVNCTGRSSDWIRLDAVIDINPPAVMSRTIAVPFVSMSALSATSMVIDRPSERRFPSGTRFSNGDTLVARITPCLENGKTGLVQFLGSDEPVGCGSTEFIVLRGKLGVPPEYVYPLARSRIFRDVAIASMGGADGRQRVRVAAIAALLVPFPDSAQLESYAQTVRPMFSLIHALSGRINTLRATRDLLLPRLISGELDVSRVPDPELPPMPVSQNLGEMGRL